MSKIGQTHPYVTGDTEQLVEDEIQERMRYRALDIEQELSGDPQYQEWADSYDAETREYQEENDG